MTFQHVCYSHGNKAKINTKIRKNVFQILIVHYEDDDILIYISCIEVSDEFQTSTIKIHNFAQC